MTVTNETGTDLIPELQGAFEILRQIGTAITKLGTGDHVNATIILRSIVEGIAHLIPGTLAAIYPVDAANGTLLDQAIVANDGFPTAHLQESSLLAHLQEKAIREQRRVLSYEDADVQESQQQEKPSSPLPPESVGCFPLFMRQQPLGVLFVALVQQRPFTPLELVLIDNFVNLAAIAMYHARRVADVHRDLQRKQDELNRLRRAGLLISSRLRLQDTLETILRMALDVTGARYGILRLVDSNGKNLVTKAFAGERLSRPAVESLPINTTSITGWVGKYKQPLRINDVRRSPWSRIYYPLDYDLEMRSELAVPLIGANGRLEGVINLESPRVGAFTEEDSHLLQALATQAVIAIQEARLLNALQDITWKVLTAPLPHVLEQLATHAMELLNISASAIWVLEGDHLVIRAASGNQPTGDRIPIEGSLAGEAVRARRPVTSADVREDPRFYRRPLARERGWGSALVVPMLIGDSMEPVGAFSVYSDVSDPIPFDESEWDKKVLTILAHYAALAVHNARRQRELQRTQEQHAVAETFAALGDIAANVLHHLNNKVGTIPVRVQGIEDKCANVVESHPYLAQNLAAIEESARAALDEVRESLSLLHPIKRAPVSVQTCVQDALRAVSVPKGIRITTKGLQDLPPVIAGQRSLTLVFVNLLHNAIEALQAHGEIDIQGREINGWVEVTVRDTGPGIPAELHERIFDINVSPRGQAHRLGFGLWWVKTLMVRLGGNVRVESAPGEGSTFILALPATRPK